MGNHNNVTDQHKPEKPLSEFLKMGAKLLAQVIKTERQALLTRTLLFISN